MKEGNIYQISIRPKRVLFIENVSSAFIGCSLQTAFVNKNTDSDWAFAWW